MRLLSGSSKILKKEIICVYLFLSCAVCTEKSQNNKGSIHSHENYCNKDNTKSSCSEDNKIKECIELNDKTLGPEDPSWMVIVPQGRLGNHLVAYSVIQALAHTLHIRPLIMEETKQYLEKYFDVKHDILIFEDTFCNKEEIKQSIMKYFDGSIDELVKDTRYHK